MKLVRFESESGKADGVIKDGGIVSLGAAGLPRLDMMQIIAGGPATVDALRDAVRKSKPDHRLDGVKLLAPFRPGKYLAIGMNFKKHMEEAAKLGVQQPAKQFWFNKQTTCIAGPYDDIDPGVTEKLDYEVELGVVIGTPAKGVSEQEASRHIFGYVVANDVSARDWQFHSPTFTVGKSFDTHGPIGPWIVTSDEIPDPQALDLRCYVNGEIRQSSNTREMIHTIYSQINYLSTAFTLESGDLLATGTPEGVGIGMTPPTFLKAGDIVRCEIFGIGAIENVVKG
jgi:2-keto-4-pentenoate hydratase/2-oxohepta-3-ene-1,7-dioic acid hydratase in catechol pathway